VRLVLAWGSRIALMGVALGFVLSLWLTRVVAGQLYEVTARDPLTFVAGSLFLLIVAMGATLIPPCAGPASTQ
jgi:putative ABC transport system permease protein